MPLVTDKVRGKFRFISKVIIVYGRLSFVKAVEKNAEFSG
jgi:hypothetical protein